jgi:putative SOS response-associated peptidase YedK
MQSTENLLESRRLKMCGRFALYSNPETIARRFGVKMHMPPDIHPRYNIVPTHPIPIVRQEGETRRVTLVRWGLIPHWAKDMKIGYSTINARAETVADKPAFRNAFWHRHCLIPADGFYEWQVIPGSKNKQPWFIALKDRETMAFAGLWEVWQNPEGVSIESCTIIVTTANEIMRPIHDRMPVILAPGDWDAWLEEALSGRSYGNVAG